MPRFSREEPPARGVIITLRVSEEERAVIDQLAERIGAATRAAVLRAGLDLLAAQHPPDGDKKKR